MERQWVDEVLYLHSLWRRGPSQPSATAPASPRLQPKAKLGKTRRKQPKPPIPDIKWPSPPSPPPPLDDARWPDPAPKAPTPRLPLPAEEKARAAAVQLQHSAISSCRAFCQGDDSDEESPIEDDEDMEESKVFKFLLDLFKQDADLRGYYEKNYEKGDFCCLICESLGIKVGRKFPDCVSLVQHLDSITRTKRKEAHRALGRAVCQVLAWDVHRLPSIVLAMDEPLGKSLAGPSNTKVGEQNIRLPDNPVDIHDIGDDMNLGNQRTDLTIKPINDA